MSRKYAVKMPLSVAPQANEQQAVDALRAVFAQGRSHFINPQGNPFDIQIHTEQESALAALGTNAQELSVGIRPFYKAKAIWLTVQDPDTPEDSTQANIECAFSAESLTTFFEAANYGADAPLKQLAELTTEGTATFNLLVRDALLSDAVENIQLALPKEPTEETVNLQDSYSSFIKSPWDVDPVTSILSGDRYELEMALDEANIDYQFQNDDQVVNEVIQEHADEAALDDILLALETLGYTADEVKADLSTYAEELLKDRGGAVCLKPEGTCALSVTPTIPVGTRDEREGIYITFDGYTSSICNAVIDDHYLAALDTLKMDVKSWIDYVADEFSLNPINWAFDLKAVIDSEVPNTRQHFHGMVWEGATAERLGLKLQELLFVGNPDLLSPDFLSLDSLSESAIEQFSDAQKEGVDYLNDLVMEVLKHIAQDLDTQWMLDNGIDLDHFASLPSTRMQQEAYPQIKNAPNYTRAIESCMNNDLAYEWTHPPHKEAPTNPVLTNPLLRSIFNNASYSGVLTFAFQADLDDLQAMRSAADSNNGSKFEIDGSVYIHSFDNGAGDGEPMVAPITVDAKEFIDNWIIRNDAMRSYGIEGTYGDFPQGSVLVDFPDGITHSNDAMAPANDFAPSM